MSQETVTKKPKLEMQASGSVSIVKCETKRKQELALPRPFSLPSNFSHSVVSGLEEKHLVGKARTKFITAIASAMFQHKSYPTRDEYDHVVQQVFRKWPFLRVRNGDVSLANSIILSYIINHCTSGI